MSGNFFLEEYLSACATAEDAFPVFLHSQVSRNERLRYLKELVASHRVYESRDNGIKYVLDYSIAKHLLAVPENAVRYTALMTDIESDKVRYIENILEYFPVFSDDESYTFVRPHAERVRVAADERIDNLDLDKIISARLGEVFERNAGNVDLLQEVVLINAEIALKALGWEGLLSVEKLLEFSKFIFDMFRGDISSLLNEQDLDNIHATLSTLCDEKFVAKCLGDDFGSLNENEIMPAIFAQWISGFLTPCVTWVVYTFLRRFDVNIVDKSGNYGCPQKQEKYKTGCLRDFIPFQAIHRLVVRDLVIEGVEFSKGDFVCIVPDALWFSTNESIVSTVIGAPNRPCMGMHASSKIVDAYEHYFLTHTENISTWSIRYELSPSLSALEFSELLIFRNI